MHIRLEKFDHARRQNRYYVLRISQTLFGEWCLTCEAGQIGQAGHMRRIYLNGPVAAASEIERLKALKVRKGYAVIPVQMALL